MLRIIPIPLADLRDYNIMFGLLTVIKAHVRLYYSNNGFSEMFGWS